MSKKLYVHFEEAEPNFTSPFALEPTVTFAALADAFCGKYNAKHGSSRTLQQHAVQCKVGRFGGPFCLWLVFLFLMTGCSLQQSDESRQPGKRICECWRGRVCTYQSRCHLQR